MATPTLTPELILYIVVVGLLPALLWLWFWLREDNVNPEPRSMIFITFLLGAIAVLFVIPIQRFALDAIDPTSILGLFTAASIEEILKFLAVGLVALPGGSIDEPVDYPIYFITAAMGFAALENALFLVDPQLSSHFTIGLLAGHLRFLGSTLLHSVASATIGISIGLAYYRSWFTKKLYTIIGVIASVALHTAFNFFIINKGGNNVLIVYAFLWVATVMIMLVFEKLRRISMYGDE